MPENTSRRDMYSHYLGAATQGPSEYIEGMEASGQKQFVSEETTMPAEGPWEALLELGFGEPEPTHDSLFVKTTLPRGWAKQSTGHNMWSDIVDARGVVRVKVFYKAAFYDRSANCVLVCAGAKYAQDAIYGDPDPAELPVQWNQLTGDEKADFVKTVQDYLERVREHPDIYESRAPRARRLLMLTRTGLND